MIRKIFKRKRPIYVWKGSSGRDYEVFVCDYTFSFFVICPTCGFDSECPSQCCDKCEEDLHEFAYLERRLVNIIGRPSVKQLYLYRELLFRRVIVR